MARNSLENIRVAAIMTDGFEQIEFVSPRNALVNESAVVHILAPTGREEEGSVLGLHHMNPGDRFEVDSTIEEASPEDYDAVLLPGGVVNADHLRVNEAAQSFLRQINDDNKPIFVICHGPWLLVSAGLVRGRRITSYHTLKDDMINAGAIWSDEPVVIDDNFISSRHPGDLEKFNAAMMEKLSRMDVSAMHAHARQEIEGGDIWLSEE